MNPSVTQFGKFMETLKLDIENVEKTRARYHFRYVGISGMYLYVQLYTLFIGRPNFNISVKN